MKKFKIAIFFLIGFIANGQVSTDTIMSNILNEKRVVSISVPPSYQKNKDKKYPVLILLDGEYLFDAFNGALSYAYFWDDLPEIIVVGVQQNKNNERELDCEISDRGFPEGKSKKFYDFINIELLDVLEKKYRISPFKIIGGHEITAGFLNLLMFENNPVFNAFISFSPEFGPEMEVRIAERLASFKKPLFYYHSIADADLAETREVSKILDQNIKKIENKELYYKFDEFKDTSHYAMVLKSIPNALYHLFNVFQPISSKEYSEKIEPLKKDYVVYLSKKYDIIEKIFNTKIKVRLNDFTAIETAILKNKVFTELDALAAIARKSYPKSMLADYYLGLMYESLGDAKKATKYYLEAYQKEEIKDLTKDLMIEKSEFLKKNFIKKGKELPNQAPAEPIKEEEVPAKEKQ